MRPGILAGLTLGLVTFAHDSATAQFKGPRGSESSPARHGWLSSFREGKAQAKKSGKPLMVVLRCEP